MYLTPSEFFDFPSFLFQVINLAFTVATFAVVIFKYKDKDGE